MLLLGTPFQTLDEKGFWPQGLPSPDRAVSLMSHAITPSHCLDDCEAVRTPEQCRAVVKGMGSGERLSGLITGSATFQLRDLGLVTLGTVYFMGL